MKQNEQSEDVLMHNDDKDIDKRLIQEHWIETVFKLCVYAVIIFALYVICAYILKKVV